MNIFLFFILLSATSIITFSNFFTILKTFAPVVYYPRDVYNALSPLPIRLQLYTLGCMQHDLRYQAAQEYIFSTFVVDLNNPACVKVLLSGYSSTTRPKVDMAASSWRSNKERGTAEIIFTGITQHIKHLHITKLNDNGRIRDVTSPDLEQLLDTGLTPFLASTPNLETLTLGFTDHALIKPSWQRLLYSACPPDREADDNSRITAGKTNWLLNVDITRRLDNSQDDEIYRNLPALHHVHSLTVQTTMRYFGDGNVNRKGRIRAGVEGLAAVINQSPHLKSLKVGFGYGNDFDFDDVLNLVKSDMTLSLVSLQLSNVGSPKMHPNIKRLVNLRSVVLDNDFNDKEFWQGLKREQIWLSTIHVQHVGPSFNSYLKIVGLIGKLSSITLTGVSGDAEADQNEHGQSFWDALQLHSRYIKHLHVRPYYYGSYSWLPRSLAAKTLHKLEALSTLSIVPAGEIINDRRFQTAREFVHDFIEDIWTHPSLKEVTFLTATENVERGAECGTNAVYHGQMMTELYMKRIIMVRGAQRPGFVVRLKSDWIRSGTTWESVEGADGWQFVRRKDVRKVLGSMFNEIVQELKMWYEEVAQKWY